MSRPLPAGPLVLRPPAEQVRLFADRYRARVAPAALARVTSVAEELGLVFGPEELVVIAALDTPDKVQEFLNQRVYYNNDHASVETEETAHPPRRVLETALAHCFEGAMLAYAVNTLHGHEPRMVLLEARQDSEHNVVLWRDPATGLYGGNAHSRFPGLDGRRAQFPSVRALAATYVPFYYSDRTNDPQDLTLVGYSEPVDLLAKYGTAWMGATEPLWDIYYTYVDDTWRFHFFSDAEGAPPHLYPVVRALAAGWIRVDGGHPVVCPEALPAAARALWDEFWRVFGPNDERRPRGPARALEEEFARLTGTTPIDLDDNASDLQFFLQAGYRIEQLLTRR
ncbi:MAG: hypothetical protein HY906_21885 [Deltaproteobacteria bacterium]|nr:hypothetical protein [Deltaproteobacteria bacterium]